MFKVKFLIRRGNEPGRIKSSTNDYDWPGNEIYFLGENSPDRALNYAKMFKCTPARVKGRIETPDVLGAIIDLGHCLNFLAEKWPTLLPTRPHPHLHNPQ